MRCNGEGIKDELCTVLSTSAVMVKTVVTVVNLFSGSDHGHGVCLSGMGLPVLPITTDDGGIRGQHPALACMRLLPCSWWW